MTADPGSPESGTARGAGLRRTDIVEAGLCLVDSVGLRGFSMRALADELGIRAASLYHHFRNKEELTAAMADRVIGAALLAEPERTSWDAALAVHARSLRAALRAQRDGAHLVAGTVTTGPNTIALVRQWSAAIDSTNLELEQRFQVGLTLFSFVLGHVMDRDSHAVIDSGATEFSDAGTRAFAHAFANVASRTDDVFETGLALVLTGARHTIIGGG